VYQFIGKLSGINVLFDPDWRGVQIPVDLNGVTLMEALRITALQSHTFWRPVTPNTIYVAQDTPQKRRELEQNVVKTFYLANLSATTELQDVVNTLRTIMDQPAPKLIQVASQGAVVIRGTPDQVALAEKLVSDLDKARPEVIVEVAVMQITRQKIHDIGILPPTSATVQLQPNITTTNTTGTGTTSGTTSGTTTPTPGSINLNRLGNLGAKDFVVTIPQASANLLFTDSQTKLIQNPQIRALDGQKASLKIGERVPVATGSFSSSTAVVSALVNTQFQYIDVGVNVDITPTVHSGGEVTLKLAMDISAVDSHVSIGGIDQPVIGQRKIEHTIRLKEGEVNLMGGILEDQDIKSLSGYPWISSVPILKYLFSSEHSDKRQNEIVFALIPHIVRSQDLTSTNLRALDVGTASSIQLRPTAQPVAGPETPAPGGGAQPPATTPPPAGTPEPAPAPAPGASTAPAQPQGIALSFNPPRTSVRVGQTFMVDLVANGAQDLFSVASQLQYDSARLQLVNISNGGFMTQQGQQAVALVHRDEPASGMVQITANRPPNSGGVSGQGPVLTLTFTAKAEGQAGIAISRARLKDAGDRDISVSGTPAVVEINKK
jgi:general secretion pathway protein D